MAHFDYNLHLWNENCKIADSTPETEITKKPRFEVLIQHSGDLKKKAKKQEEKPEKQEIILISSKKIKMKDLYYGVDKKDNFEKIPGVRMGCEGYWKDIGTAEKPEPHMVVTNLFINEPEHKVSPDCIVYIWKLSN